MPRVAPVPDRMCHRPVGAADPWARGDALWMVRVADQLMNLLQEAARVGDCWGHQSFAATSFVHGVSSSKRPAAVLVIQSGLASSARPTAIRSNSPPS